MIKKVLVTGATGFIGSNLLEHLGGQEVEVYRGVRALDANSDKFDVLCDLTDLSSISVIPNNYNFDVIVLTALSKWRCCTVGVASAESFIAGRIIVK